MQYKFLIYISYSYSLPIGDPLEEEIKKRGYTVKWFGDTKEGKNALQHKTNVLNTIEEVITYDPHVILTATNVVPDFLKGLKVQVFHGFDAMKRNRPGKLDYDHFNIRSLFDLYCTQGPHSTSIFKSLSKKVDHFEVIETGFGKVDGLFPIKPTPKKEIPTVFIASTFTKKISLALNDAVYKEIKRLSKTGKFNFSMVLHPKLSLEIKNKWKALNNKHFKFHDTTYLIPLMKEAEIMFSDTTSAIQEFGLQGKLIVTFNHHAPKPFLINITEVSQIEKSLEFALTHPENILNELASYNNDMHPYFDGKSSERIIQTTIDFLHKNKSYLKNKPLNLIRKYKIRKRLNYFTLKSYNKPFTIELKNNDG